MSRILLLDVMGTLVYDPFYVEVPAFFGMSLDELMKVKHPRAWLDFEFGRCDEATFLANFFADGRAYDHEGLKRAMFESYRFLDGIEQLLDDLRTAGVTMHLASNYAPWYRAIEERLELERYAPWTFVSCNWGLRKPDAAVYQGLIERLDRDPGELVFVDDAEINCAAAEALGMVGHRFRTADILRRELKAQGLL